tara:strand:+ start:70 stop:576 length:507 start_codon:yes stop_codon:yes gene_type:complete
MSKKNHNRKKHSNRGRLRSQKVTDKIDEAARKANKRVDDAGGVLTGASTGKFFKTLVYGKDDENKKNKSVPRPKKKPTPPKVPTIKAKPGKMKRRPTMEEQLEASGVGIDYTQMEGGGLIGGQKKLDANKDGKISGVDFEMMGANRKKYGGKITYKMAGGQVVDSSYD